VVRHSSRARRSDGDTPAKAEQDARAEQYRARFTVITSKGHSRREPEPIDRWLMLADKVLLNAAREQRYHWITNTFDPIPLDTHAARIYGALCATVRAVGRDPKPRRFDLLIAAVAVALGIPLITRNEADFTSIHDSLTIIAVR